MSASSSAAAALRMGAKFAKTKNGSDPSTPPFRLRKQRSIVLLGGHRAGKYPAVLVVHENRGLNPYIEDVARRLGTANFIAFAPDGLTSVGGYPGDDEGGGQLFGKVDRAKMTEDFIASINWLKARPESTGRHGVVGFCFGGAISNTLAVRLPELGAAVPFYGGAPAAEDVPKIKAAVLVPTAS